MPQFSEFQENQKSIKNPKQEQFERIDQTRSDLIIMLTRDCYQTPKVQRAIEAVSFALDEVIRAVSRDYVQVSSPAVGVGGETPWQGNCPIF